jgi:hypothetical protein
VSKGSFGAYAVGDRLRVAVEGGVVKYSRNGSLLYTSSQAVQYPLLVDTALYNSGTALSDIAVAGNFGPGPVAPPVFNPSGGTYTTPQTVSVSSATPFAEIRYTLDGTEPVPSSTPYAAPISIGTTTTLEARAWRTGLTPSTTTSSTYTMSFGTLAAPAMSPAAGTYVDSVTVTLTALPGATIRYTTDGSDPTAGSTAYADPVTLAATTTLKAKAFHPDYSPSTTTTRTYTVKVATPLLSLPAGTTRRHRGDGHGRVGGATLFYTLDGTDPTENDTRSSRGSIVVGTSSSRCGRSHGIRAERHRGGDVCGDRSALRGLLAVGDGFALPVSRTAS